MSTTHIPRALRTETTTYFEGRCAYCQSPQALMNVAFEVDHIYPEKAGGQTVTSNLAFACPLCNTFKAVLTHGRDPLTEKNVALFHPRIQRWSRHFRWEDDGHTIEGRTRNGRATVEALHLNNPYLLRLRTIWIAIGSTPPDWPTPSFVGTRSEER